MTVIDRTRIQVPQEPTLRLATDDDVSRLTSVLAAAFHEDPIFGWLMPDEGHEAGALAAFLRARVTARGAHAGLCVDVERTQRSSPVPASRRLAPAYACSIRSRAQLRAGVWRSSPKSGGTPVNDRATPHSRTALLLCLRRRVSRSPGAGARHRAHATNP